MSVQRRVLRPHPAGIKPMAQKIVFVIDVTGSMSGRMLEVANTSYAVMINTLDKYDIFVVQSFSDDPCKQHVMQLSTGGGTNLNPAFLVLAITRLEMTRLRYK